MFFDLLNLDVRTLIGILFWGNLIFAVLIYSYLAIQKKSYDQKHIAILFKSKLLQCAYCLLVFFRGIVPDLLSVNLSNTLLFICVYLEGYLMLVLSNISSRKPYLVLKIFLICSIFIFNFIDLFFKIPELRVTVASLCVFVILAIPCLKIMFSKNIGKFTKIAGSFYLLLLIFMFPRAIYTFYISDTYIFTNNTIQSLAFLALVSIMIYSAPAFLLILKENTDRIIEKMATTDGLTKISNRQGFMIAAQAYFERYKASGDKMAVLFIDIDFFKKVNDQYGHSFGDEVLVKVAEIIKNNIRPEDRTCRYGGEEFLVFLPDGDENKARLVGERIMKKIKELHFDIHPEFKFTISAGIYAGTPKDGDTLAAFIDSADKALYQAKNTGKNKIVVHQDGLRSMDC